MKKKIHLFLPNFIEIFLKGITTLLLAPLLITCPSYGNIDLDRQFKLESVGCLKPLDNVDDLFAAPLSNSCKDLFSKQNRFSYRDLSHIENVIKRSKLSYSKVIEDPEILKEIAKTTQLDTLIRTKIIKKANQYFFTIDWLHTPHMEILSSIQFELTEPAAGTALSPQTIEHHIESQLSLLLNQVPNLSYVSGRDHHSVVVTLNNPPEVHKNDTLYVGTLDEVKEHPLLKRIVGWHTLPTGKLVVEQVEDGMAFCRILQEEPERKISKYQKITHVKFNEENQIATLQESKKEEEAENEPALLKPRKSENIPRLGWIGMGGSAGSFGWNMSNGNTSYSGGGFLLGSNIESQIWLTQDWFTEFGLGHAFWNFRQSDTSTGLPTAASANGGVPASVLNFKLALGYSYHFTSELEGSMGWIKLSYKSNTYSFPLSPSSELTGPFTLSSWLVGIGGNIPVLNPWGAWIDFNFRLFSSISQSWYPADPSSVSHIELFFGPYYQWSPQLLVRAGIDLIANSTGFSDGATLSQKIITFHPTILYYF